MMGNLYSKALLKNDKITSDVIDPRSPTVNIDRSPIGNKASTEEHSVTKVRDLTSVLTEYSGSAQQTPICLTIERMQSALDPRSPCTITRTPLLLDEINASNVTLQGSSIEYEEVSYEEELPENEMSLSFKDCEENFETETTRNGNSIFSDASLNSELKAEIDSIIQELYSTAKDPRSPSVNIQRTPIVFEEDEQQKVDEKESNKQSSEHIGKKERSDTAENTPVITIHEDEGQLTTPKLEKNNINTRTVASRTPLSCVTNAKQSSAMTSSSMMRKSALLGQIKQNIAIYGNGAEFTQGGKSSKSRIPTLMKK